MKIVFKATTGVSFECTLARMRYEKFWDEHKNVITQSFYKHTGLRFKQATITAYVWEKRNSSAGIHGAPMKLTSVAEHDYDLESTLVHELAHRLLMGHKITSYARNSLAAEYVMHKQIDLFLYDVYKDIFGVTIANELVAYEKTHSPRYKKAWEQALAKTYEERQRSMTYLRSHIK